MKNNSNTIQITAQNINNKDQFGNTFLHQAVAQWNLQLVQQLMSIIGADQNIVNNQGLTALNMACVLTCQVRAQKNFQAEKILQSIGEFLCNHNNQPNFTLINFQDQNPLSWIAELRNPNLIEKVLSSTKIDIDTKDGEGKTVLYWMIEYSMKDPNWIDMVKLFITKGAKLNAKPNMAGTKNALDLTLDSGNTVLIQAVLNTGDVKGNTVLFYLVKGNKLALVKDYIQKYGADLNIANKEGITPFYQACISKNQEMVEFLSNHKPNINLDDLQMICEKGGGEMIKITFNTKDAKGNTTLHNAVLAQNEGLVKILMECGVDQNIQNNDGLTPLYLACALKNVNIAKVLGLHDNAAPNLALVDNTGQTALSWIAELKDVELLEKAINTGQADIDATDVNGKTLLIWMVEYASKDHSWNEMVKCVINSNANVALCRNDKATPLYIATSTNNEEVIEMLLEKGANPNLAFQSGDCPINIACNIGNMNVIKLLVKHGAKLDNGSLIEGNMPMHNAFFSAKIEVIEFLLLKGISINVSNKNGKLPVHFLLEDANKNQNITIEQKINVIKKFSSKIDFVTKNPENGLSAYDFAEKHVSDICKDVFEEFNNLDINNDVADEVKLFGEED